MILHVPQLIAGPCAFLFHKMTTFLVFCIFPGPQTGPHDQPGLGRSMGMGSRSARTAGAGAAGAAGEAGAAGAAAAVEPRGAQKSDGFRHVGLPSCDKQQEARYYHLSQPFPIHLQ